MSSLLIGTAVLSCLRILARQQPRQPEEALAAAQADVQNGGTLRPLQNGVPTEEVRGVQGGGVLLGGVPETETALAAAQGEVQGATGSDTGPNGEGQGRGRGVGRR